MSGMTTTVAITNPVVTQVISSTVAPSEPAQVRRRHRDDRRVDRAHQRPEGDRQRDQPLVDRRAGGRDGEGSGGGAHDAGPHAAAGRRVSMRSASTTSPLLGSW